MIPIVRGATSVRAAALADREDTATRCSALGFAAAKVPGARGGGEVRQKIEVPAVRLRELGAPYRVRDIEAEGNVMNVAAKDFTQNDLRAGAQGVSRPARLLIMDTQPIVVRGLTEALRNEGDFQICGVATSIAQASRVIQSERPDVALSEIAFADGNLLNWIEAFQVLRPDLQFMIFTSHSDRAYLQRAMRLNVSGFILKNSDSEAILHALRSSRKGGIYVDPAILGQAVGKQVKRPETLEAALSGVVDRLSDREFHTLRLVAFGYSIKEIARELGVSPKSIETYKARAGQKLGLASRASIVRYAIASGWFDDEGGADARTGLKGGVAAATCATQ